MKPENVKKVLECFRGYQIHYRPRNPERIIAALKKNMSGDLSPSQFYDDTDSKVHIFVKQYVEYLLNQEALEKAQEHQALAQQKAKQETNEVKEKTQKQKFIYSKGRIRVRTAKPRGNQHLRNSNTKNNSSPTGPRRHNPQIYSIKKYSANSP